MGKKNNNWKMKKFVAFFFAFFTSFGVFLFAYFLLLIRVLVEVQKDAQKLSASIYRFRHDAEGDAAVAPNGQIAPVKTRVVHRKLFLDESAPAPLADWPPSCRDDAAALLDNLANFSFDAVQCDKCGASVATIKSRQCANCKAPYFRNPVSGTQLSIRPVLIIIAKLPHCYARFVLLIRV